jgi:hypothetical protein
MYISNSKKGFRYSIRIAPIYIAEREIPEETAEREKKGVVNC